MSQIRSVFLVSDHTGITADVLSRSLLSQFPDEAFAYVSLPFVDTVAKAEEAAKTIKNAALHSSKRPIVFSTLTAEDERKALSECGACVIDMFNHFLGTLEQEIGHAAVPRSGQFHGMQDKNAYHNRIEAVNYSLSHDDGVGMDKYDRAELILVGVSRSGKTPTSLYMAMQYGMMVANYPLTPEDFEQGRLPARVLAYRAKLRGLTLSPHRLAQIRAERRPNSEYAKPETCAKELEMADRMMRSAGIPVFDSTSRSIEEISTLLRQSLTAA